MWLRDVVAKRTKIPAFNAIFLSNDVNFLRLLKGLKLHIKNKET